jgi:hypothetical protein
MGIFVVRSNIEIEILNWEKFNPRKDLKATSWVRLQNSIFEDHQFFDFDHSEICFWIYLISLASKKQNGTVLLNLAHAERIGRFSIETIHSAIQKLSNIDCVQKHSEHVTSTSRARTTTNERTNNETDAHERNDDETNANVTDTRTHVTNTKSKTKPSAESASADLGKQSSEVIARYCELWKARYKTNISFSNKWAGNAKTLVKDHGKARAIELVEAFMEMNDRWFLDNRHSFDLLLTKLASITHYAGTGVVVTQTQLNQLDKTQANKTALQGAIDYFKNQGDQNAE